MTITTYTPTQLQQDLAIYLEASNAQSDLPQAAVDAVNTYINIAHVPTLADLVTLSNSLNAISLTSTSSLESLDLRIFENLIDIELTALKLGNPMDDLILANGQYPMDDLGVTYSSILSDLKTVLADSSNIDTVAHFADAIFYTINALNPSLSLEQLTADIQATVDSGISLADLAAFIITSLNAINTATAATISNAVYSSVFSADEANLYSDIVNTEKLYNLNQVKSNLVNACTSPDYAANDSFAGAIYNAMLGLDSPNLSLDRINRDIEAGVANVGDLATLRANIRAQLTSIAPLATSTELLRDAVFFANGLIPSDPHDLSKDLPPANTLLGLQHIRTALIDAINSFAGSSADDLATAIQTAINGVSGVTLNLPEAELANDISASGDLSVLVSNIYAALNALNPNTLTAVSLTNALYANGLIVSGHKKNFIDDLVATQTAMNYASTVNNDLINPITDSYTVDRIAGRIYNAVGGSEHGLTLAKITRDVQATVDNIGFDALKDSLLDALTTIAADPASLSVEKIANALYSDNTIVSSDVADMTTDINAAETALDYKSLILALQNVCGNVSGSTTALVFAQNLVDTITNFASIVPESVAQDIANAITFAINNNVQGANFYNNSNLQAVANNINENLQNLMDNKIFSADAIDAAIFNVFDPSDDTRLAVDVMSTENFKTLATIRTGLVSLCPQNLGVDPSPASCAQFIIDTVQNSNSFTPALSQENLANDITATIAQGTMVSGQPTMFQSLMYNITSNLQGIHTNALTATGIQQALYNSNDGIVSAAPYLLANDLANANSLKNIQRIKIALVDYLSTINTPETDVSSISMAKGMINAINISSDVVTSSLTPVQLNGDISYTVSQDEGDFGDGNYELVNSLILALQGVDDSAPAIEAAVFSDSTILKVSKSCAADPFNANDDSNFLSYINAVNTASKSYNLIIQAIITNLSSLSGSYTSLDVANAIINAIVVTGDRGLTASLLQANIDKTSGSLSSKATALVNALTPLASDATTDINAIEAALFSSIGGSGVLADSTVDSDNLLADINSSVGATDNYQVIINQIKNNLNNINMGGLISTDARANAIAGAIVTGADLIVSGPYGSLSQFFLQSTDLKNDILFTTSDMSGLSDLRDTLVSRLSALSGVDVSATGIKNAIYADAAIHLTTANTLYVKYLDDLEAAAAAHSSFPLIKSAFATGLNNYAGTTANGLATDIRNAVVDLTGVNLVTTNGQLSGDITTTIGDANPAAAIPALASNVRTSMGQTIITNVNTAAGNMANAIFGSNIGQGYDVNLLKQDLTANELSREPGVYQLIVNNYQSSFAGGNSANYATRNAFASLLFNTLAAYSPTWTLPRVTQDVYSSAGTDNPVLNSGYSSLAGTLRTSLTGISNFTATNIANAVYADGVLVKSAADKSAMQTDVGASFVSYGGANGLAARIQAALENLPADYTEAEVAAAIVEGVTPTAVNPTPFLSESYATYDLSFTEGYMPTDLTTIVSNLISNLQDVIDNPNATATDLDSAIYNIVDGVVASDRDEVNFELDLEASRDSYNNYAVIKTALSSIDDTSSASAASYVMNNLLLQYNNLSLSDLTYTFDYNLVGGVTIGTLIGEINSNVSNANIANVVNAPMNIVRAFYVPLQSVSAFNLTADIIVADEIDNAVTVTSAIGTAGVCTNGASHVVYACTKSNNVATVGDLIATNDCSVSGAVTAARACDVWAYSQVDHYISYDGAICSDYLSGQEAAIACRIGLDLAIG